jgi:hypothetical protein
LGAIIGDFGKDKEGVNLYRINGSKAEIKKAIDDLIELGCEVWEPYELEQAHKHFSVLIKLQIPEVKETQGK